MTIPPLLRHPVALYLWGCVLLLLSSFFLVEHVLSVRRLASVTLPIAVQIPSLERRLQVMEEQIRTAELQDAVRGDAVVEAVRVATLPSSPALPSLIELFDVFRDVLTGQKVLRRMTPLTAGAATGVSPLPSLAAVPLTVTAELRPAGADPLLWFFRHPGALVIADVLQPEERTLLFEGTEKENPAGIVVLERFLSTDLLRYAQSPLPVEEELRKVFRSPAFAEAFQRVTGGSLASVRTFLGGSLGATLLQKRLWPPRAVALRTVTVEPLGEYGRFSFSLQAYHRPGTPGRNDQ